MLLPESFLHKMSWNGVDPNLPIYFFDVGYECKFGQSEAKQNGKQFRVGNGCQTWFCTRRRKHAKLHGGTGGFKYCMMGYKLM